MKITFNEMVETLAPAIADKLNLRAVLECHDGGYYLIDFSSCGDPFRGDMVCSWSLQDSGRGELSYGTFNSFFDVFMFVFGQAMVVGSKLYVESF